MSSLRRALAVSVGLLAGLLGVLAHALAHWADNEARDLAGKPRLSREEREFARAVRVASETPFTPEMLFEIQRRQDKLAREVSYE